jgi:hypothetical protein
MSQSLAERTRAAAREHPFLVAALRAGVLNYAAAARFLPVEGDEDAVATALRRFRDDLPDRETASREARVTMESGVGLAADGTGADGALLSVGGSAVVPDAGSETGVLATGDVDAAALRAVLGRLAVADVTATAAGVADDALLVVVGRRDGPAAVRAVEAALEAVSA